MYQIENHSDETIFKQRHLRVVCRDGRGVGVGESVYVCV